MPNIKYLHSKNRVCVWLDAPLALEHKGLVSLLFDGWTMYVHPLLILWGEDASIGCCSWIHSYRHLCCGNSLLHHVRHASISTQPFRDNISVFTLRAILSIPSGGRGVFIPSL